MGVVIINVVFVLCIKSKAFETRTLEDIYKDIDLYSIKYPSASRVFLADGDALNFRYKYLLQILNYLNKSFT